MIDKSAYMLRISQASPVQLVVISFELILDFLAGALAAADADAGRANIQKAKNGLDQLIQALDFNVPLSHDFYEIYSYSFRRLSEAHSAADKAAAASAVKEVAELMETLLAGWRDTAEKTAGDIPAGGVPAGGIPAGGVPKIYSGLTYGRDGQAQEYIHEDKDRGYMA